MFRILGDGKSQFIPFQVLACQGDRLRFVFPQGNRLSDCDGGLIRQRDAYNNPDALAGKKRFVEGAVEDGDFSGDSTGRVE